MSSDNFKRSDKQPVKPQSKPPAKQPSKPPTHPKNKKAAEDRSFARPINEDDDGYDPWSDRPAKREPLFQADPWN